MKDEDYIQPNSWTFGRLRSLAHAAKPLLHKKQVADWVALQNASGIDAFAKTGEERLMLVLASLLIQEPGKVQTQRPALGRPSACTFELRPLCRHLSLRAAFSLVGLACGHEIFFAGGLVVGDGTQIVREDECDERWMTKCLRPGAASPFMNIWDRRQIELMVFSFLDYIVSRF